MARTLSFYNIFIQKKDKKDVVKYDINCGEVIDKIFAIPRLERKVEIDGNSVILEKIEREKTNYHHLKFEKYREDYKPDVGSVENGVKGQIEDTIIEKTCILIDSKHRVCVIEFSPEGVREKKILEYLNKFLNSEYEFILESIDNGITLSDVENTDRIKNIVVELKLTAKNKEIFNENLKNASKDNPFLMLFKGLHLEELHENLSADTFCFSLSTGKSKKEKTLTLEAIQEVIGIFNLESDIIKSVKLSFNKNDKLVPINLKNIIKTKKATILHNQNKNLGHEFILDSMREEYKLNHEMKLASKKNKFDLEKCNEEYFKISSN